MLKEVDLNEIFITEEKFLNTYLEKFDEAIWEEKFLQTYLDDLPIPVSREEELLTSYLDQFQEHYQKYLDKQNEVLDRIEKPVIENLTKEMDYEKISLGSRVKEKERTITWDTWSSSWLSQLKRIEDSMANERTLKPLLAKKEHYDSLSNNFSVSYAIFKAWHRFHGFLLGRYQKEEVLAAEKEVLDTLDIARQSIETAFRSTVSAR